MKFNYKFNFGIMDLLNNYLLLKLNCRLKNFEIKWILIEQQFIVVTVNISDDFLMILATFCISIQIQ